MTVPANDLLVDAIELVDLAGTVTGLSNVEATVEAGETRSHTTWYWFDLPTSETLSFRILSDVAYDSYLTLYKVNDGGSRDVATDLTQVAYNDDTGGNGTSYIKDYLAAPGRYCVQLAGYGASYSSANYGFQWSLRSPILVPSYTPKQVWPASAYGAIVPESSAVGHYLVGATNGQWVSTVPPEQLPTAGTAGNILKSTGTGWISSVPGNPLPNAGSDGNLLTATAGVWASAEAPTLSDAYKGPWVSGTTYKKGDVVTLNGRSWVAVVNPATPAILKNANSYAGTDVAFSIPAPGSAAVGDFQILLITQYQEQTIASIPADFTLVYNPTTEYSTVRVYTRTLITDGSVELGVCSQQTAVELRTYSGATGVTLIGSGDGLTTTAINTSAPSVLVGWAAYTAYQYGYNVRADPTLSEIPPYTSFIFVAGASAEGKPVAGVLPAYSATLNAHNATNSIGYYGPPHWYALAIASAPATTFDASTWQAVSMAEGGAADSHKGNWEVGTSYAKGDVVVADSRTWLAVADAPVRPVFKASKTKNATGQTGAFTLDAPEGTKIGDFQVLFMCGYGQSFRGVPADFIQAFASANTDASAIRIYTRVVTDAGAASFPNFNDNLTVHLRTYSGVPSVSVLGSGTGLTTTAISTTASLAVVGHTVWQNYDFTLNSDIDTLNPNNDKWAYSLGGTVADGIPVAGSLPSYTATKVGTGGYQGSEWAVVALGAPMPTLFSAGTTWKLLGLAEGAQGDSAYAVAVAAGFVGTQAEWLDSYSAYNTAVASGFVGTKEQWLASLVGPKGDEGPIGVTGVVNGLPTRLTAAYTTATLASSATETGLLALALGYRLMKVVADRSCRIRVYATAAQRDADVSRPSSSEPSSPNHGVIWDFSIPPSQLTWVLPVIVEGANMEDVPSVNIPITITNLDSSAGTVVVNLTYIRSE